MTEPYSPPSFDYRIDMMSRPGSKWQIMTYVNHGEIGAFAKGMTNKGLFRRFNMRTKLFPHKSKTWLLLNLRDGNEPTDFVEARKLTRLIKNHDRPIYWKEGKYGYEINEHGHIKRKWELGTGYVVKVKTFDLPSS